jgi:hypothetical protein
MSKPIKDRKLLSFGLFELSPSRRWLLKALGLTPTVVASRAAAFRSPNNPDESLRDLERKILSARAIVDQLIIRQGVAERVLWKAPANPRRQMALDAIDCDLAKAHECLAELFARLNESRATTLLGLQVKARLTAYDDEIAPIPLRRYPGLAGFRRSSCDR